MSLSQTEKFLKIKEAYGGSDKSSASFLRPDHVTYNSVSKARDFGKIDNLNATIEGSLGSESGTNTLFFKVQTSGESDLLVTRNTVGKYLDKYISVGILDAERRPMQLNIDGYTYNNEIINTEEEELLLKMPAGVYYFTVRSDQWQAIPYSATLRVFLYRELFGNTTGTISPYGRIGLMKLYGFTLGTNQNVATLRAPAGIKRLSGKAGGSALPTLEIVIRIRGTIMMTATPYGTIPATHRISGVASGSCPNIGTLTVTSPYGGG